jgi:hypothetical protein
VVAPHLSLWLAFIASFAFIFLRAFQQRNVVHDNYWWVIPTSMAMAATEAVVIVNIAQQGWYLPLVLAVGVGSGSGCIAAMLFHKHYVLKHR